MKISFYFDPVCPWCWITSRWIMNVSKDRDIDIVFRSFSLALKNGVLGDDDANEYAPAANRSHKVLRVCERIRELHGDTKVAEFYTLAGKKIHIEESQDNNWVAQVIEELGLDAGLIDALEDEALDEVLQKSLDSAIEIAGDDVGVPLFAVDDESGSRGFFGPVISELPDKEQGLALWDGIISMVDFPHFYELKRTRNVDPNVSSTSLS